MGWDLARVADRDAVDECLTCPVCTDVLKDAVKCPNEHQCCATCRQMTDSCPTCRDGGAPTASRLVRQMVDKIIVRCVHGGCAHQERVETILTHERDCAYKPLPCPNAPLCDVSLLKAAQPAHVAVCPFQTILCYHCDSPVRRRDISTHSCLASVLEKVGNLRAA